MEKTKYLVLPLLVLAIFAYGAASALDVFLPAFFLPEEAAHHSHDSHSSYCGFVFQSPDYLCVHALPVLDTSEVPSIDQDGKLETSETAEAELIISSTFNHYRFRAPPQA